MNKTAIKNFAIWARRKLIADITYKAGMVGVSENGIAQPLPQSTRDLQFFDICTKNYAEVSGAAIEQRNALVKVIQAKERGSDYKTAFRNVVEEVAYTWFNRLIAVRFMEVNDYLPSKVRVLSSESEGKLEPDFVTMPFETDLDFSPYERDQVLQLKDNNKLDELFRMLFIKQCNKLSEILPGLFEKISDYTELLLNISFTDKDGIVYHLTHDISEDEFNVEKEGQVEIIGWMYQYYNTEPKDEVFALLKKNVKITKERIPAATQLFTPDWIVRYMVENSLGRLWVEGHPNERLKENWKYYLEEAEQEPDVIVQLKKIREEYAQLNPTDIKLIDPCMGSGHILVYAFDVLMQIYVSQGYTERDAAKSILINNLYGIDIDTRAYQLAYFAVMMKARQFNRKIFSEHITPNLIAIKNPENVSKSVLKRLGGLEPVGLRMLEDFEDAEEYGSLLNVGYDVDELTRVENKLVEIEQEAQYGNLLVQMEVAECVRMVRPLIKQARLLAQKYDVVVTNPPYMGSTGMSDKLGGFVKKHYPDSKSDLFAVFIERCRALSKIRGCQAMITQHAWMFLSSFEKLRTKLKDIAVLSLAHLGTRAFEEIGGEVVQTASFIFLNQPIKKYIGTYVRLVDSGNQDSKELTFVSGKCRYYACQDAFDKVPGKPYAYWLSPAIIRLFANDTPLSKYGETRKGLSTSDNNRFIRLWHEVSFQKVKFGCATPADTFDVNFKWYPYIHGGVYRKWYPPFDSVVNFENDAKEMKDTVMKKYPYLRNPDFVVKKTDIYFQPGIIWNDLADVFNAKYMGPGYIYSDVTPSYIPHKYMNSTLAYFNSKSFALIASVISQGMHYSTGHIPTIPYVEITDEQNAIISPLVEENIELVKNDETAFETSWGFASHPLVVKKRNNNERAYEKSKKLLSECFTCWENECNRNYIKLKINEEELNRIFIEIYGLQDELTPEVADKDVTVRKADLGRDIRSLISYAVGCMFGRYSLDVPGLAYAGGNWDSSRYSSFFPDADNCIPITDTEYFQDDIVGRFVEFVRVVYGAEALEDNLNFIAKALGNKGNTSRDVIRNYFLNDFYKDHLKVYQKRPIYWLFDSGKENGFKALVYMHRWNADTVGNVRVEYLHKMQTVYEHEVESYQYMIDHGNNHEIAVATKRKEKLMKQIKECKDYDAFVAHIALSRIDIDLDDGVKVNYRKVQTSTDGKFCEILANSKEIMAKEK